MTSPDAARVARRLTALAGELDGAAMSARLRRMGKAAQRAADEAVRATPVARGSLSDGSMSGWHRGNPVRLATRITMRRDGTGVLVTPDRTAGLWRVLESGRRAALKGERVARGVTRSGNVRHRRVKRNVGATSPKRTWTQAERRMERAVKIAMAREMSSAFTRAMRG